MINILDFKEKIIEIVLGVFYVIMIKNKVFPVFFYHKKFENKTIF